MTPIIITLSLLIPSQLGRQISGTDLGTEVWFVVFIPDLNCLIILDYGESFLGPTFNWGRLSLV